MPADELVNLIDNYFDDGEPFAAFAVPLGASAGWFKGARHLAFTPGEVAMLGVKGDMRRGFRVHAVLDRMPWSSVTGYSSVAISQGQAVTFKCRIDGALATWRWSASVGLEGVSPALNFFRYADRNELERWWATAMDGSQGDRDVVNYLDTLLPFVNPQWPIVEDVGFNAIGRIDGVGSSIKVTFNS